MKHKNHRRRKILRWSKMFDWWSVPHFMFGMVTALCAITFEWPAFDIFLITTILALLWELLEKKYRLSEAPGNAWVDVVLALLAFVTTYLLVDTSPLNHEGHVGLLTITLMLYCVINMLAWRARWDHDKQFMG